MTDQKPKKDLNGLEKYATSSVLKISGSILVLSIALNQIGFRVDRILDAWSEAIVLETKLKYSANCPVFDAPEIIAPDPVDLSPIEMRLSILEGMAHEQGVK